LDRLSKKDRRVLVKVKELGSSSPKQVEASLPGEYDLMLVLDSIFRLCRDRPDLIRWEKGGYKYVGPK